MNILSPKSDSYTLLWLTATIVLLIWYLQYYCKRRNFYKYSSQVPGPKGWPLIGNILDFTGNCDDITDNITSHIESYPHLAKIWYGPVLVYLVSKPEYLKTVLSSPKALTKMYFYRYLEPLCGHGLFTAPVPTWKRHRKIIMPAFNQKVLDGFVEVFGRRYTVLCEQLKNYVGGQTFDLFDVIGRCSLDVLCETSMGVKVNTLCQEPGFGQCIERLIKIMFLRMFVPWYHFDYIFKCTRLYQEDQQLAKKYTVFTEKIIKERLTAFEEKFEHYHLERKAFLDLLIEQSIGENKLTIDEIRDEVNTFVIAGSDTTATTICFILIMLGMHSQIQDLVHREICEVLGPDRVVLPEDLPSLKYTERVIKETLRLFPIGPYIMRYIEDDVPLEGDVILPKGSSVIMAILYLHRNSEYWPNPLKFDPDRFLREEIAKRHAFSYLPFSGGARNCIGGKYAEMAIKAMLATVIRKFKFSTSYKNVEDIKLRTNLLLRPVDGFNIGIQLR